MATYEDSSTIKSIWCPSFDEIFLRFVAMKFLREGDPANPPMRMTFWSPNQHSLMMDGRVGNLRPELEAQHPMLEKVVLS